MSGIMADGTRRSLLMLGGTGLLAACGGLPGQRPGPALFRITRKSSFDPGLPTVDWSLAVAEPTAQPSLDSDRIAFVKESLQVDYYADAIWEARAPVMLQKLVVQSFLASDRIADVGSDREQLSAGMLLRLDLRAFNTREAVGAPLVVRVAVLAQLLRLPRRTIVATQSLEQEVPITAKGMEGVVAAFDEAAGNVMRRLVEWCLRSGSTVAAGDPTRVLLG